MVIFVLILSCPFVFAYEDLDPDPLKLISVSVEGDEIEFKVELQEGYRAYSDRFKLTPSELFSDIEIKPEQVFFDPVTQKEKIGIIGSGTIYTHVEMYDKSIDGVLTYQACTDTVCLLPKDVPFTASLGSDNKFSRALNKGLIYALITIFLAGFLTSLTPCVFPMIPITISILGSKVIDQARFKSFLISTSYVLGIATTYSILGVIASSTGSILGAYMADPKFIIVLSSIFVLMGLSMYGLFEIRLPQFVVDKLNVEKRGYLGVFLSGIIAGVIASPCIGPVLVGLLLYTSTTQSMFLGFLFLFTFALGFGVLLVLLGIFSQLVNKLPKSGGWLEGAKFVFGTVMIAMGLFYIKSILHDRIFYILAGLVAVAIALSFGLLKSKSATFALRLKKATLSIIFAIGLLFFTKSIFYKTFESFFPSGGAKIFQPYEQQLFEDALANTPIVLDFWAAWCPSCIKLDKETFSDSRVIEALSDFLLLKIDNTLNTDINKELKSKLKVIGLPTVVFYDKDGHLREDMTLTGYESADRFLERLKKL